ncbi:GNAT family N-acetyltransferase [Primorskyibacter sp. S187A]|uniref:GNAT family N-acetyltransferase n=1 Tax=Primorskyibacter sp. S187A TaxID=3415130 RepID=UPI003C79F199
MTIAQPKEASGARPPEPTGDASSKGELVHVLKGFDVRTYAKASEIPFEPANAALLDYVHGQQKVLLEVAGLKVDAAAHVRTFWSHIDEYLAPKGSFYLAWSPEGKIMGTGAMRQVDDKTGEMKHLYVHPDARGAGLGRWLVERRMQDAKAQGLTTLVADTLRGNVAMPRLYASLGFEEVSPGAESRSVGVMPELIDHLRFFRRKL